MDCAFLGSDIIVSEIFQILNPTHSGNPLYASSAYYTLPCRAFLFFHQFSFSILSVRLFSLYKKKPGKKVGLQKQGD